MNPLRLAWIVLLAPVMQAQTDATMPWAVLATRSVSVQNASTGPWVVNASGDLYVANPIPGVSPTKTFGDVSNGGTPVSKMSAAGGFSIRLGGLYYINQLALDSAGNVLIAGPGTARAAP